MRVGLPGWVWVDGCEVVRAPVRAPVRAAVLACHLFFHPRPPTLAAAAIALSTAAALAAFTVLS